MTRFASTRRSLLAVAAALATGGVAAQTAEPGAASQCWVRPATGRAIR